MTYFTFTVSLSVASSDQVTVKYQTESWGQAEAGSDYQAKSRTLVFAPSNCPASREDWRLLGPLHLSDSPRSGRHPR